MGLCSGVTAGLLVVDRNVCMLCVICLCLALGGIANWYLYALLNCSMMLIVLC